MITAVSGSQLAPGELAPLVPASRTPRIYAERDSETGQGTMQQGWIKLHRTLEDHPFWLSEPFTKPQAWIDLLLLANHQPGFFFAAGRKVPVDRGQVGRSLLTLGKRWKWSRGKVDRYMDFLESEGMVSLKTGQHNSIVTICNYNTFQGEDNGANTPDRTADDTPDGHQTGQQTDTRQDTNKNVNNGKNVENGKNLLFTEFWKIYPGPRKKDKPKSKTLFNKQSLAIQELIISHLKHRTQNDPEWTKEGGRFIPGPVPFLRQNGWTDEYRINQLSHFDEKTQGSIRAGQNFLAEHPE